MLFDTWQYVVFLPLMVGLYHLLPQRGRVVLLLAGSYFFYMSWRAEYAILLLASTLTDYLVALRLARTDRPVSRRALLGVSLLVNLGLLFAFKYYGLFAATAQDLGETMGFAWNVPELRVLLPVGISFYTFQTLSYTIDVYTGRSEPERSLLHFAVYVSFFPQLVAGPIERPSGLLPQLHHRQPLVPAKVANGLKLIAWGLLLKMVIADRLGPYVDTVYGHLNRYEGPQVLQATFFFAYQIYCDFAGYSYIAIGSAMLLGIDLMKNFDRPYAASTPREFWQRWHISLSTWFRDYLYIPLGGNRKGKGRGYVNLLVVFLVSGLWHGASWTFVLWGAWHGVWLVLFNLAEPLLDRGRKSARWWARACTSAGSYVVTMLVVLAGWLVFRAQSFQACRQLLERLTRGWATDDGRGPLAALIELPGGYGGWWARTSLMLIVGMELVSYWQRRKMRSLFANAPWPIRWTFYVGLGLLLLNFSSATDQPFIYFQF